MGGAYATALGRATRHALSNGGVRRGGRHDHERSRVRSWRAARQAGAIAPRRLGAAGIQVTLKVPFIPDCACGSHWNVYVPFLRVTVIFLVPTNGTLVTTLATPGPKMWKLCEFD